MIYNPRVYIDKSPVHGWGVFAACDINEGDVIEECPVIKLPIEKGEGSSLLIDYRFNWPQGIEWDEQVFSFGFGGLYNHSNDANAYWISNESRKTFIFKASKNIRKNSEIFVYYGDENYWNDGRTHTIVD